jgi:hypothetical protein
VRRRRAPAHRSPHLVCVLAVVAATSLAASCADGSSATHSVDARQLPAVTLPCERALAEGSALPTSELGFGYESFFRKVALPTGTALGFGPSGHTNPNAQLFAKAGLFVKPGSNFELVVPRALRGRLTISWAGAPNTLRLRVAGCNAPADSPRKIWIGFPGGYFAPEPACVSVLVKSAGRTARAPIGIGVPCPGQGPVPATVPNAA